MLAINISIGYLKALWLVFLRQILQLVKKLQPIALFKIIQYFGLSKQ